MALTSPSGTGLVSWFWVSWFWGSGIGVSGFVVLASPPPPPPHPSTAEVGIGLRHHESAEIPRKMDVLLNCV